MRLIDANELTTALDGYQHHITLIKKNSRKTEEAILCDVKGIINSAPTIEERKKGKWIGKPIAGYATVRCPACKDVFRENTGRWNFCPNCGAEMGENND